MLQSRNSTAAKYMCMSEVHLLKIPLSLSKLIRQLTSPPAEFSTPKNEQPVKTPDNSPQSHIYIPQSYFFFYMLVSFYSHFRSLSKVLKVILPENSISSRFIKSFS